MFLNWKETNKGKFESKLSVSVLKVKDFIQLQAVIR